jgi:uncharacterized protein DUF6526
MATATQSFENHKRNYWLFHFTAAPLLALYALYALYAFVRAPSLATIAAVALAAGVIAALFASRIMVLTVQNRVIRLEMQLRLERVLGTAAAADAISRLPLRRLVALRFASDGELQPLIARALSGEFESSAELKRAIREWQPDLLRA